MFRGESQSWEEAQLEMVANNHHLLNSFQTVKFINVGLLAVLIYDHCLTFNLERERMWTLSWKVPKCLFLFNRYLLPPLFFFESFSNATHVGETICNIRIFMPIPTTAAILTVELMLVLRVLALYNNSPRLAGYLLVQFVVQMVSGFLLSGFLLFRTKSIAGQNVFTGCLYTVPNWASLLWAPLLVVECILAILIIYRCRNYGAFSPTAKVLAQDSAVYFISIFTVITLNMFYAHQNPLLSMALSSPTSVLASIAASRLSMNIRGIAVERGIATLTQQSQIFKPSSFSRSSRRRGNSNDAGTGKIGAISTQAVSSPTGIPARQREEALERCYYSDEEEERWRELEEQNQLGGDEEIRLEDRGVVARRRANDLEGARA